MKKLLIIYLCILFASAVMAAMSPEAVARCKAATAMIANPRFSAVAFCIDKRGYYVTYQYSASSDKDCKLIINPGEKEQEILPFEVVYNSDSVMILKVIRNKESTVIEFGDDSALIETTPVTIFEFPDGKGLSKDNIYPNMTVATGNISALRKDDKILKEIQFDAASSTGVIGSPVCNDLGQAVGIVSKTIYNTRINNAIPIDILRETLSKRSLTLEASLFRDEVLQEKSFDFKINTALPDDTTYDVEMVLWDTPDKRYAYKAEYTGNGNYHVKTVIPSVKFIPLYHLSIAKGEESFSCDTDQKYIYYDGIGVSLDKTEEITRLNRLNKLKSDKFEISGIDNVPILFENISGYINLSAADAFSSRINEEKNIIFYCVNMKKNQEQVATFNGSLTFNYPTLSKNMTSGNIIISEPSLIKPAVKINFPAQIADIVTGGGGRYFFLYIKYLKKIAIFDINSCSIVKYIKLDTYNALMAAGNNRLLIYSPVNNQLTSYALSNSFTSNRSDTIKLDSLTMGSSSNGPVIIGTNKTSDLKNYEFYDLYTLKKINTDTPLTGNGLNVSGNGKVIYYQIERAAEIANKAVFDNNNITFKPGKYTIRQPGVDGTLNYGLVEGIYDDNSNRIKPDILTGKYLPICGGNFFMSLDNNRINFYLASTQKLICTLSDKIVADIISDPDFSTALPLEKSIYYVPEAKMLVLIPASLNKIVIYRFDIEAELKKSGLNYFYIASTSNTVSSGYNTFIYKLAVKSSAGNVAYKLEKGPENMKISSDGIVTWQFPFNQMVSVSADVVISVSDASGDIRSQSFTINRAN